MKYTEIILLVILVCGFLYILPCRMNIEGINGNKDGESLVKEGERKLIGYLKGIVPSSLGDELLGTGSNIHRIVRVPDKKQLNFDPVEIEGGVCFDANLGQEDRADGKKCSAIKNKDNCVKEVCHATEALSKVCKPGYLSSACVWQDLKYTYFGDLNTECGSTEVSYLNQPTPNKDNGVVTLQYHTPATWDSLPNDEYSSPKKECIIPGELYEADQYDQPSPVSDPKMAAYYFGQNKMFNP